MKKILRKSRHLRWNWIISPEDSEKIRYYFNVVDDKFREEKIKQILDKIQGGTIINFNFEGIQTLEGKVKGTNFRYLCRIYDSICSSSLASSAVQKVFGKSVVKDPNLYDRTKSGTSLEDYLVKLYEE